MGKGREENGGKEGGRKGSKGPQASL